MRIGCSRAYSSATSAVSPATRPIDEDELARSRRKAEVVEHGGQRPVDVDGKGLDLAACSAASSARTKAMPSPASPALARHLEQHVHPRVRRCARDARGPGSAPAADRGRRRAWPRRNRDGPTRFGRRSTPAAIISMQAGAGAAVLVADGQQHPAATAADSDSRLPDAASRARRARTARLRRDPQRRSGSRPAAARSRASAAGR